MTERGTGRTSGTVRSQGMQTAERPPPENGSADAGCGWTPELRRSLPRGLGAALTLGGESPQPENTGSRRIEEPAVKEKVEITPVQRGSARKAMLWEGPGASREVGSPATAPRGGGEAGRPGTL